MQCVRQYLRQIQKTYSAGNATEHSYRPALKSLVESLAKGVTATNEPKRVKCGAPGFIVDRKTVPFGYIECEDIGVALEEAGKSGQIKRYPDGLENLILTHHLESCHFVAGRRADASRAETGLE